MVEVSFTSTMKNFFYFLFIAVLLISCEKKGTITGTLVDACGAPISNQRVRLLENVPNGEGKTVESVLTDVNGYFAIPYKSKRSSFALQSFSGNEVKVILKDIPAKKHIDFDKINSFVIYNLYIKLKVNNPYTSNDTIKINIYGGTQPVYMKINGPFTSGIVDSVMNQTLTNFPYKYNEKPHITYQYSFTKYGGNFKAKKDIYSCSNNEILFVID